MPSVHGRFFFYDDFCFRCAPLSESNPFQLRWRIAGGIEMIESNGPRLRTSTKRGCGLPASQILGEVARHDVRCDSRSRSSQPQPAPRFLDPRLRILAAEAFQKCFDGWLSAIPRGYF